MADAFTVPGDPWAELYFAYNEGIVDEMKQLPIHARYWNPEKRCWMVLQVYRVQVTKILERNGENLRWFGQVQGGSDPLAALFDLVPVPLHEQLYRHLSLVLHPDVGGDNLLMQRLNTLWLRRREV